MTDTRASGSTDVSTAELMRQLSEQTSRLVRDEVRLAQAELTAKVRHGGIGAGLFGAGGVLALYGVGVLVAAGVAGLALLVPVWAAALIVAVVLFAAAGVAALGGRKQVAQASPKPERTIVNVRRDVEETKERMHRDHHA